MRFGAAVLTAVVASGAAVQIAPAQEGQSEVYEHVDLHFTSHAPKHRSGFAWHVRQRPVAADEQPPPVRRARLRFPRGTRIDTSAVQRCTATEAELQAGGTSACPARSRLGGGEGTIYIGSPQQITAQVDAFNADGSALLVLSTEAGAVLRVIRGTVARNVIDATLPRVDLAGGKEAALTSLSVRLRAAGTRRHPWLRTPRRCPARGSWKFVYDISYDDPPGDQSPFSRSRCER